MGALSLARLKFGVAGGSLQPGIHRDGNGALATRGCLIICVHFHGGTAKTVLDKA